MRAYHIVPARRLLALVRWRTLEDLQRLVGGPIEWAHGWDTGDVLFVDEEGRRKPEPLVWWGIKQNGRISPLCGPGVVLGPALPDTPTLAHADPRMSPAELRELITWLQ